MTSKDDFDRAALRRQLDHDDLQREFAGLDAGRIRRFLPDQKSTEIEQKKRRETERLMTALQILLLNPTYARVHADVSNFLNNEKEAIERARQKLIEELSEAESALAELRASASSLPDGRLVFAGDNGELIDELGSTLSESERSEVLISKAMPQWKDYRETQETAKGLRRQIHEVDSYEEDFIDPALKRLDSQENPYQLEELKNLPDAIERKRPERLQREFEEREFSEISIEADSTYGIEKPGFEQQEIASKFDKARLEIPDIDVEEGDIDIREKPEIEIKPV